jgi:hypothetical protein
MVILEIDPPYLVTLASSMRVALKTQVAPLRDRQGLTDMTKCVKPLRHLETISTKSSKWSVLIGRAGRLSTKSH